MIDRERVLAPFGGDAPAGPNLRLVAGDTTLADLADLRRFEDPALDPDGRGKDADWRGVARLCTTVLTERSKDLQVAAHLTEAQAHLEGFPGVADGLKLVRELIVEFWPTLHPGVEEGEVIPALRSRWVSWLGSSRDFLAAIRSVVLTSGPGVPARRWLDYENSRRVDAAGLQSDKKQYQELIALGLIPGSEWQAAVAGTPHDRLKATLDGIGACEEEVRLLTATCNERFPEETPNLVELSNLLGDIKEYLGKRLGSPAGAEEDAAPAQEGAAAPAAGGKAGPIGSRDEAFRRLREAADYLRRVEPHSPVPYLVDRAVGWGEMPFKDVIRDVLRDDKAFKSILETLGMHD